MNCDQHYTWVACNPGEPGAYAAHTDDPRYRRLLHNFKRREKRKGATVIRVTCNEAQALLYKHLQPSAAPQSPQEKS